MDDLEFLFDVVISRLFSVKLAITSSETHSQSGKLRASLAEPISSRARISWNRKRRVRSPELLVGNSWILSRRRTETELVN
jgi:hypothetical protein